MRSYTRHQLKQDKFAEATKETFSWVVAHQKKLVTATVVAVVVFGALLGAWFYVQQQDRKASVQLAEALRTYHAGLRRPDSPQQPGTESYTSAAERAQAAQQKFQAVAQNYGMTRSADIARYYLGLTAVDIGDTAAAERELKQTADSRNEDLASLGKFALASFYRSAGREKDAIQLYKELIEKPTRSVPKENAQLELASIYEKTQPAEAMRLYQQIRTDSPGGPAAEIATMRLESARR